VREAVKDLDYTYRLVASGKRKCERPGSEEPEPHVALSPGVTVREQRRIDIDIARIDAAHDAPSTAPHPRGQGRKRRHLPEVKEEKEGGKGKTEAAAEAHHPDIKCRTPQPKAEMLDKTEAAADISSSGSMKYALPRSAEPQQPVALGRNYWHWGGGRRRQQGSSSEIVTTREQEKINGALPH
jgi:hypothetical protein